MNTKHFKFVLPIVLLAALLMSACSAIGGQPAPTASAAQLRATADVLETTSPDATTAVPAPDGTGTETFTYVPGGNNYAWPNDGVENLTDGWTRIRQAANGQFLTWTFLARIACDRNVGDQLQWDSATRLNLYGPINCKVEVKRDLESSKTINPDPYTQANSKNSPLGLGLFIYGQGEINVNGSAMKLNGPGVKQMAFPHDWTGIWTITVNVPENGLIVLLQGEKITGPDTWPLP